MGKLNKLEQRFETLVNDVFAKIFRSAAQPLEFAGALRRECDVSARIWTQDCTIAPNGFVLELSPGDHEVYSACLVMLGEELVEKVRAHAEEQQYSFVGPLKVQLQRAENLKIGQYRVRSRLEVPPEIEHALRVDQYYRATHAKAVGAGSSGTRAGPPPAQVLRGDKRALTVDQFISMGLSFSENGSLVRATPPGPLAAPPRPLPPRPARDGPPGRRRPVSARSRGACPCRPRWASGARPRRSPCAHSLP